MSSLDTRVNMLAKAKTRLKYRLDKYENQDSKQLNGNPAGYYVQRNADNLIFFALARYIQSKTGDHPYLPVVRNKELDSDPWDPPTATVEYATQEGQLVIAGLDEDADLSGSDNCSDYGFEDAVGGGESLNLTALTDLTEYPADYQEDLAVFLESIEGMEDGEE
ncbi:Glucan endo-1,3-alpha-glucosidase agn1 [Neofusicoccum parvum]|uniref:Glucan endo-1,3-alpha-glucosidase agn1 n=1 Tax=Neofusicoccum parvum TaxID=310453 RepID=A0ACB5SDH9_9PEZI|nr:Glucan endo-1,3-alpha-glucosidase agn1 [Neofusicoccum parvum]